jgi:hypothetical protein
MTHPPAPHWEGPGNPFQRWLSTAGALLFRPEAGYGAMTPGPAGPSIAFAALGLAVGLLVGSAPLVGFSLLSGLVNEGQGIEMLGIAAASLVGGALGLVVTMGVFTALTHLLLLVTGGASGGFSQTVRAIAYGYGSAAPGLVLPYCGWPLFAVGGTVSAAFGLAALHRIGLGRAVVALLVPSFVSAGIVVALLAAALAQTSFH